MSRWRADMTARFLFALLAIAYASPATAQKVERPELLDRMVGEWRMEGEVRGRAVTYDLFATWTLGNRYVELYMKDVTQPPRYEARVFIGADTIPNRILVHWLDSFGAAYSVPHGVGRLAGDTVRFDVAYTTSTFRDTFVYDRVSGSWTLRIESVNADGRGRLFAHYIIKRKTSNP